ncbi:unnamed protein product [Cuscuta europaea]|uniref:Retrotransposon Copia-like N-terminal domain-containing protein n=1 Tax=Cuscuta europaea TaxID=41803 RepID=A0A9P0ZT18_CUSEU|nr:unnamed protein product [Cuscuta europaea]
MAGETGSGEGGREQGERRKINDPSSPYYLSSSDFPGLHICAVVLKGESNYRKWATAMKNAFRAKRKLGFLDVTIKRPTNNERDLEDWHTVNSMAVGWIMTSADPAIRSNLAYMDIVCDLCPTELPDHKNSPEIPKRIKFLLDYSKTLKERDFYS